MQRRRCQLYSRRRKKLRRARSTDVLLDAFAEREEGRNHRREIERGEDRHGVAQREQRIRGRWNHPLDRRLRAEHFRKLRVFDQAQRHVDAGRGNEFGDAGCGHLGRLVVEGGRGRVEGVGNEVGAGVDHEDEGEGLGEQ